MRYNLVSPEDFTAEQKEFVYCHTNPVFIERVSQLMPKIGFGIKDINSRYVIVGSYTAYVNGFSKGEEFIGLFDCDVPGKIAEFAQEFVDEDKKLLGYQDKNRISSMLNIHEYFTGLAAFRADKHPLTHEPSQSILGSIFTMCKVDLSYFFTLLPNYLREFGTNGNIESIGDSSEINDIHLTEYEHEVAFLITMSWRPRQIADFMNKYRPRSVPRTHDTIYKCQNRICEKFDCEMRQLRDKLIEISVHRKIPSSFFERLIGFGNTPIPS